jgi:hypothetical protein
MRILAKYDSAVLLVLFAAVCCWPHCAVAQQSHSPMLPEDKSLRAFLRKYVSEPSASEVDNTVRYFSAPVDLGDDGKEEILVYIEGRDWCGSGGCMMLILAPREGSYQVITKTTITRTPIRVLSSKTHGWHDIGVFVAGGGTLSGYEARLEFNGKKYPSNPSIPPAKRIVGEVAGRVVIPSEADVTALYP